MFRPLAGSAVCLTFVARSRPQLKKFLAVKPGTDAKAAAKHAEQEKALAIKSQFLKLQRFDLQAALGAASPRLAGRARC